MLAWLFNPAVIGLGALLLAIVWMLRDENDKIRPLLVIALVLNLAYGWVLSIVMGKANGLVPWKYDYVLLRLDSVLGLRAAPIAGAFHFALIPLFVVYQLMVPMMVAWFFVARSAQQSRAIIVAYVAELLTGPALYAIVPACGPVYAFHKQWLTPPAVEATAIKLSGMPNAFPSLHVATALLFVLFAPTRLTRGIALAFLAATALATLATGEHYVIDLVAGLAVGCFAAAVGRRRMAAWMLFGGLSIGWSLSVRFANGFLIAHPALLKTLAVVTIVAVVAELVQQWRSTQEICVSEAPQAVADTAQ
jgi:hypothetical protein